MPVRWTETNKLLLFQKVFEQAPNFKIDFQSICNNWPGSDALTIRAAQDQWAACKKDILRNASGPGLTLNPRTPAKSTPRKQTATNSLKKLSVDSGNKRGSGNASNLVSPTKKRKIRHEDDTSEVSAKTSEDEKELSDEETEEDIAESDPSPSPVVRRQPLRSRARAKPIVDSESTSGNDVAKSDPGDEDDSDFDVKKDYENRLSPAEKTRLKRERRIQQRNESARSGKELLKTKKSTTVPSGITTEWKGDTSSMLTDLSNNLEEDGDDEDVKSDITKRTSWQSAQSHFED